MPTLPDVWLVYRSNPSISFWDTRHLADIAAKFPFMACFAYTIDETNYMADVLLPEATDLESEQMIRVGGTKYMEQFWDYKGVALRQKAVEPQGEARDFTWIATQLAKRCGLLDKYVSAINKGVAGVAPLKGDGYDFSLAGEPSPERIWDAVCRVATLTLSEGREEHGIDWYREHGFYTVPISRLEWYLTPTLVRQGLRYELPYQERLLRAGRELGRRMHERNMNWWDKQLAEYQALPEWHDVPARWIRNLEKSGAKAADFPFWLLTTKSMQYHAGGNAAIAMMGEIAQNVRGHTGVIINADTAANLGIADGDRIEVRSHIGATYGRATLAQGVRPDTLVIIGQFDHWATPYAKDLGMPSLNTIAPMSLDLTDATGSGRTSSASRCGVSRRWRHETLRHGDRPASLRRLPDVHRRLQERQCDATRRPVAPCSRPGKRRVSGRAQELRSRRLHALRQPAMRRGLPDDGDEKAGRRPGDHRLRHLHRLCQLHHGLPLRCTLDRA
jgi:phenylacetyl-CoA:acceptor oxidoreductase